MSLAERNRKTSRHLWLVVAGMFAFGFAMVPLYGLICEVGGINGVAGKSGGRMADSNTFAVDDKRLITVQFDSTVNANLPWEFHPLTRQLQVHPGELTTVSYYVRNTTDRPITGQAIPGITPWQVTQHFKKLECFCFTQQTLQAGEGKEMPVRFAIDPAVATEYQTVTLSYTFMNTEQLSKN